jgi:hypothetical protein
MDREHVRPVADLGDESERLHRVVRQLLVHGGTEGIRRRDHQHGVAVGIRLRGQLDAEISARARAIVHHERLAQAIAQMLREQAADDVVAAARRKGDDEAHRPRRPIGCGVRRRVQHAKRRTAYCQST